MISALAALGVFASVPLVGCFALQATRLDHRGPGRPVVAIAAGLAIWSVPLLGSLILRVYRPELLGILGWLTVAVLAFAMWRGTVRLRRPTHEEIALAVGLVVSFLVYALLPNDPLITGRDMGVYAAHGVYMAEHGRLDVPYPLGVPVTDAPPEAWIDYAGLYSTLPTQTVQFGHLLPAWLGQAYAVGGFDALLRVNPAFATFAVWAVHATARRFLPWHVAVVAAMFLALNAGHVWVARTTLSEPLTQLFVWCSFLLLVWRGQPLGRAALAWAGAFAGMAVVVRIDSLVMLPLFLVGWSVASALGSRDAARHVPLPFFAAYVPISLLGAAYYALFSTPYFTDLGPQLRLIAGATLVAVIVAAALSVPAVRPRAAGILRSAPFLAASVITALALAAFAYFVRPAQEPFDLVSAPGHPSDGIRSHVEDAIRNVGMYVGHPVVWLGVAGWAVLTVTAVRSRAALLPVLLVIGGYSALYFWDQSIFPDHFWAIRRFVPIVIPGVIVSAAVAGWFLLSRFPLRARPWLLSLAVIGLGAQLWQAGTPLFYTPERAGSYAALESVAAATPHDVETVGIFNATGIKAYATPLFLVFDEQVPAYDATSPEGRTMVLDELTTASDSNPVHVITEMLDADEFLVGETLAVTQHAYAVFPPTTEPVPYEVTERTLPLLAKRVVGLSTLGIRFNIGTSWLLTEEGFHGVERVGDRFARWTTDSARLVVPAFGGDVARLELEFLGAGPGGSDVTVRVGADVAATINVPEHGTRAILELRTPVPAGQDVEIALEVDTFVPARVTRGSSDTRQLGTLVSSVRLLPREGG